MTGVFRAAGVRVNPRLRETKSVYKTYLDVVHIEKTEAASLFTLSTEEEEAEVAGLAGGPAPDPAEVRTDHVTGAELAERRARLWEMAQGPEVCEKLAASLAPSIWQLDDVKKGLLCQLFGGVSKVCVMWGGEEEMKSLSRCNLL